MRTTLDAGHDAQRAEIPATGLDMLGVSTARVDQLQRPLKNLHLSVITQCDFRCTYPMRSAMMVDRVVWDGSAPRAYADAFRIRHPGRTPIAA